MDFNFESKSISLFVEEKDQEGNYKVCSLQLLSFLFLSYMCKTPGSYLMMVVFTVTLG